MARASDIARPPRRARRAWAVLRAAVAGEEHDYTQGNTGHALLLLAIPMMLEMARPVAGARCHGRCRRDEHRPRLGLPLRALLPRQRPRPHRAALAQRSGHARRSELGCGAARARRAVRVGCDEIQRAVPRRDRRCPRRFPAPLVGIFTAEPEALRYGADCLRIVGYGYGFYAVGLIMMQAFNGAGDTNTPTWLNALCFWLLQLPLAYALAKWLALGPHGVFWAAAIAESVLAVLAWSVFRRGTWKLNVV